MHALARIESEEQRGVALGRVLGAWLALVEQWHRETHGEDYTALHADVARWRPAGSKAGIVQAGTIRWAQELRSLIAAIRRASDAGFDELHWDLAFTSVSIFEHGGYRRRPRRWRWPRPSAPGTGGAGRRCRTQPAGWT
ncbi:hypothetical protein ACIREM_22195 [Streptomyces shenzhenensis]|uniref:hypothetical protein n=1 Tax=Streptomyces shenzhenensis TaxID=943815 RepID=UPI003817FF05